MIRKRSWAVTTWTNKKEDRRKATEAYRAAYRAWKDESGTRDTRPEPNEEVMAAWVAVVTESISGQVTEYRGYGSSERVAVQRAVAWAL